MLKNRMFVMTMACIMHAAMLGLVQAEEGGIVDTAGLVWGPPTWKLGETQFPNWYESTELARQYSISEDGITYDDWRLPTLAELQAAIADGTIVEALDFYSPDIVFTYHPAHFFSNEARGNRAWTLPVSMQPQNDDSTVIWTVNLTEDPPYLTLKTSTLLGIIVRDPNAPADDGKKPPKVK